MRTADEFYEDDALTWKKGDMCYAPWSDGQLYMAQIIRMKKDQAYVAFIEYEGERAWVSFLVLFLVSFCV